MKLEKSLYLLIQRLLKFGEQIAVSLDVLDLFCGKLVLHIMYLPFAWRGSRLAGLVFCSRSLSGYLLQFDKKRGMVKMALSAKVSPKHSWNAEGACPPERGAAYGYIFRSYPDRHFNRKHLQPGLPDLQKEMTAGTP